MVIAERFCRLIQYIIFGPSKFYDLETSSNIKPILKCFDHQNEKRKYKFFQIDYVLEVPIGKKPKLFRASIITQINYINNLKL